MTKMLIAALLLFSCGAFATDQAGATAEPFKLIHVQELASWMENKTQKTWVFDANIEQVRVKEGVIPGATILASSSDYDVAKTLPAAKDANLVFYCANEACSASHSAAKRAVEAGYKNVSVLADGIAGWRKAGKATDKFKAAKKS